MNKDELQPLIAAAEIYEKIFVPALMQEWASCLVEEAHVGPGDRVLDIACGTGVVARAVAERIGSSGIVVGFDRNPGMLEIARRTETGIEWRQGTVDSLPYADETFDAVICQFGLMFFPDRSLALREMMRVLARGGRLIAAVWDRLENLPALALEADVIERTAGPAARDDLRAPFVLGDREELARLVAEAGLKSASISTRHGTARFPSVRSLLEADVKGFLPLGGIQLTEDQVQKIYAEAEQVLSPYVTPEGTLVFDTSAHIVTVTKGILASVE